MTATTKSGTLAVDAVQLDGSPMTYTSADIDTSDFDYGYIEIDVANTLAPTDVIVEVLTGMSASPTHKVMDGPLGDLRYSNASGTKAETIKVPDCGDYTAIKVTATGADASNYFAISVRFIGITRGY